MRCLVSLIITDDTAEEMEIAVVHFIILGVTSGEILTPDPAVFILLFIKMKTLIMGALGDVPHISG